MSQTQLLKDAVAALESAGVGYFLSGSLASSLQGEPRATHDIDLVIEVDVRAVDSLAIAFGAELTVSAGEDTILQKLKWAAASGGSERQLRDAVGVYELQRGMLDEEYLDHWAGELGVARLLDDVRAAAAL